MVTEGLRGLAEITLAKLVNQLLLVRVLFHDLIQIAQKLMVAQGLFLLFQKGGGRLQRFIGLILMCLAEGLVEFAVEERLGQFGFFHDLLHVLKEVLQFFLLLSQFPGDFLFIVRVSQALALFLLFLLAFEFVA